MEESRVDGRRSFFRKPHGLLKRMTYKKYLQAFVARCINSKHNAVIIDGFSGTGRYEDENDPDSKEWRSEIETYGSPLIIIMVVLQCYCNIFDKINKNERDTTWKRLHQEALQLINNVGPGVEGPRFGYGPFRDNIETHIYLVELSDTNFSKMKTNIVKYLDAFFSPLKFFFGVGACRMDISLAFCRISINAFKRGFEGFQCPIIENARTCTILDPFDFKSLPMDHVRKFLGNNEREVLVTLMSAAVNSKKGASFKDVATVYGIKFSALRSDRENKLREFIEHVKMIANGDKAKMPVACAEKYIDHVKNETGARFSTLKEIRTDDILKYHLIFFSYTMKSFKSMKETNRACWFLRQVEACRLTWLSEEETFNINSRYVRELADIIFGEFKGKTVSIEKIRSFVDMKEIYVYRKAPLKLMETESNPRLTSIYNVSEATLGKERKSGTFPDDWGFWMLKFRTDDAQN